MAIREISTILTAKDEASDSLAAVSATGDDTADSMADVESETEAASEGLLELDAQASAAAASVAALGTAMQSTLDSTQDTRAQLARVATSMGMTDDEAINLAAGMTDASLSTREAAATMEALAQAGVESEEQLRETTLAIDAIADATGSSSDQIDEGIIQALRATGNEAEDVTEKMDAFTFVANETTADVNDFQRVVSSAGGDLEEMGADVEDTAAIMAALDDQGVRTRDVLRDFRSAAGDDTVDSVEDLHDEMGLTAEEFEEYRTAVDDAEGATEEYQDRANDTFSVMDELRAATSRAQLRFAGFNDTLSIAAPTLQAAGGAALLWANINTATLIPSLKAKSAALVASSTASLASVKASLAAASAKGVLAGAGFTAAGAITALWAATGPLGLAALALTGIILGLAGVMRTDLFGAGEQAEAILGRLRGGVETTVAVIRELLGIGKELGRIALTVGALGLLTPFAAVLKLPGMIRGVAPRVKSAAMSLPSKITEGLAALGPAKYALPILGPLLLAKDAITDPSKWISAGKQIPSMIANGIKATATDPVGAVTSMVDDVRDRLPFSPAAAGPLTDLGETGPGLVSTIAMGIEDEAPQLTSVVESMFAATPLGIAFNAGQSLAEGQQSSQPAQGSQPSGDAISVDITIEEINAGDGSTDAVRQAAESGLQDPVDKLIRQLSREIPQ